jgi:hypothetical protein
MSLFNSEEESTQQSHATEATDTACPICECPKMDLMVIGNFCQPSVHWCPNCGSIRTMGDIAVPVIRRPAIHKPASDDEEFKAHIIVPDDKSLREWLEDS